jgi:hypothetical protein
MIKCRQCGEPIFGSAKKCPKCGDTLKDEMLVRVRKRIKMKKRDLIIVVALVIILLVSCFLVVYDQRHYSWNEKRTSAIKDKDEHTYTYCCVHSKYGCTSYCTNTNHYFHLQDGHEASVDDGTYHKYTVGQNYTYTINHYDWKPGMKDAPIPNWVYIAPCVVALAVATVLWLLVFARREKEMKEWVETGDTDVDGEE